MSNSEYELLREYTEEFKELAKEFMVGLGPSVLAEAYRNALVDATNNSPFGPLVGDQRAVYMAQLHDKSKQFWEAVLNMADDFEEGGLPRGVVPAWGIYTHGPSQLPEGMTPEEWVGLSPEERAKEALLLASREGGQRSRYRVRTVASEPILAMVARLGRRPEAYNAFLELVLRVDSLSLLEPYLEELVREASLEEIIDLVEFFYKERPSRKKRGDRKTRRRIGAIIAKLVDYVLDPQIKREAESLSEPGDFETRGDLIREFIKLAYSYRDYENLQRLIELGIERGLISKEEAHLALALSILQWVVEKENELRGGLPPYFKLLVQTGPSVATGEDEDALNFDLGALWRELIYRISDIKQWREEANARELLNVLLKLHALYAKSDMDPLYKAYMITIVLRFKSFDFSIDLMHTLMEIAKSQETKYGFLEQVNGLVTPFAYVLAELGEMVAEELRYYLEGGTAVITTGAMGKHPEQSFLSLRRQLKDLKIEFAVLWSMLKNYIDSIRDMLLDAEKLGGLFTKEEVEQIVETLGRGEVALLRYVKYLDI